MISWAHGLLRAVNSLQLLPEKIWRHNYVIGPNCQNLPFFGYIHCNFCLNPHIIYGDMKENVSGCFFWTQCTRRAILFNLRRPIQDSYVSHQLVEYTHQTSAVSTGYALLGLAASVHALEDTGRFSSIDISVSVLLSVCLIVCLCVCVCLCRSSGAEFMGFVMSVPSRALQTIVSSLLFPL